MEKQDSLEGMVGSALVAGATVFAFAAAPLLRYVDAGLFAQLGVMSALSVMGIWVSFRLGIKAREAWFLYIFLVVGAGGILVELVVAQFYLSRSSSFCSALMTEMLARDDRRESDAALFQALGCIPNIKAGDVLITAPTEETSRVGASHP